jgi:hypothetical protein
MESSDSRKAVVGVVSGGAEVGREEEEHLLSRKTTDFSAEIRGSLKNLGAVKSSPSRPSILKAIDDGISVRGLVKMISSTSLAEGAYESDFDVMSRHADIRMSMASQTPSNTRDRKSMVSHLVGKGLSTDEAEKIADSHFGLRSRPRP